ncbi:colicin-like bacteriocin tRNase domain-containing protein, partial [Serratia sp. Ag1]|uniref:colicin-like bacteriocin tRNase domain-containing protein n=1 Tax=Serratia sp. Ag1 TaxID=1524467 RepID=UPI001268FEAA
MGGFDYGGGPGDGTSWSKERGETPAPGGGMPSSGGGSSQGSGSNSTAPTMVSSGVPGTFSLTEGFLAFGIGAAALSELASTPLAAVASSILSRAFAPLAAVWPSSIAPDDMSVIGAGVKQQQIAQVISAKDIVTVDLNTLFSQPEASVKGHVSDVIDNGKQVLAVVRDKGTPTKAPVVQAKPTGKPRQFDVSVPGLSTPLRLDVAQPSAVQPNPELDSKTFAKVTDQSAKPLSDRMQGGNTRDAIVTFPKELNMDPVYISVTRLLSEVELRQREESLAQEELNQRRAIREQAEQIVTWNWAGGVAEVTQYERRKVASEARLAERQQLLAVTQARVERLDAQARSARAVAGLLGSHHNQERMDANARAAAFEKAASEGRMQIDGLWREISTLSEQLKSATAELAQKIEATAKAEAEAKAAAEARAKAEAEARAKLAALMAKAGVNPTPVYTSEMVKLAQASLTAAGALVMNRAPGMTQLSTFAEGILTAGRTLSGSISGAISRGAVALAEAAPTVTAGTAATTIGALVVGFWPGEAGESCSGSQN